MGVMMDRKLDGRSVMVVGVDFSATSHQAVAAGINLARITRAPDVHLIHVVKPATLSGVNDWSGALSQYETAVEASRRELDALCASAIEKFALRAFAHVRTGEPYREIIQLASDVEADLIVIGTHSRAGMTRFLLGSVAEKVQRYAPCPVLTVKPKERPLASDIDPPCPFCHEIRIASNGSVPWCEEHKNLAHSFFPPSEPPPFAEAHRNEDWNYTNGTEVPDARRHS
jgi:nucleotide-binding universal stress UspA family protein